MKNDEMQVFDDEFAMNSVNTNETESQIMTDNDWEMSTADDFRIDADINNDYDNYYENNEGIDMNNSYFNYSDSDVSEDLSNYNEVLNGNEYVEEPVFVENVE